MSFTLLADFPFALADEGLENRSLPRAIELANVVADEKHNIYREFISGQENLLKERYLPMVRRVGLAMLERGRNPFSLEGR